MNETMRSSYAQNSRKKVSALLLERYRLGEVTSEERTFVEAELASGSDLSLRVNALEESDAELRRLYPFESLALKQGASKSFPAFRRGFDRKNPAREMREIWRRPGGAAIVRGACAAALLLCVLFPSLHYIRNQNTEAALNTAAAGSGDRAKGGEIKPELSIYLREASAAPLGQDDSRNKLSDSALLGEGNTVQLAYLTPPGAVYYGVIFSIDGRSQVTLHYPYRREQSPVLEAGKKTFLNEAYTLDDAPDLEIFFMVLSRDKLETESVLARAAALASEPQNAIEKSAAVFGGCEIETITIRK